jgi:hypothetical protein
MHINSFFKSVVVLTAGVALLAALLSSTGCYRSDGMTDKSQHTRVEAVVTSQDQNALVPALYAVFDDKSGSVKSARVTPLREQDLGALIDTIRLTGGELAFGLIGESTNRPLLRLRIPVPPQRPMKREVQNAFERAEQDALFQEQLEKYEVDVRNWKADVDRRASAFLSAVRPRLQEKATAKRSPINAALTRSELFLNEPVTTWPNAPHRYIILNSDAIDTTKSAPVTLLSGATLVLINGTGSLGILESLKPLRFESVQSALDHIAATEIGRNQ